MSKEKWQALNRKELLEQARKQKIVGCNAMMKDELCAALLKQEKVQEKALAKVKAKPAVQEKSKVRSQPQAAAAQHTNGAASVEQQVERSKYDVGVPPRD